MRHLTGIFCFCLLCTLGGCGLFSSGVEENGDILTDQDIGMQCEQDEDCREGLACSQEGECQPAGTSAVDNACQVTAECADGLYCNSMRVCASSGDGAKGATCATTADCEKGLICTVSGFSLLCSEPGDLEPGEECQRTSQCAAGLTCAQVPSMSKQQEERESGPQCVGGVQSPVDLVVPSWDGVTCEKGQGAAVAYFEVPRSGQTLPDFFRLPFPNDIRRTGSGIDLSGHPAPDVLDLPLIDSYLRAAEQDLTGFATNPVAFFRFSEELNFKSVNESSVHIIDITPGSPTYKREHARKWRFSSGKTKYLCENTLSIAVNENKPLRPATTYAVYLTRDVAPLVGGTFTRANDLDALLTTTAPTDATLQAAHAAYAPLRDWLVDAGKDQSSILNAAVFTTQDPEAIMADLRLAVHNAGVPAVSQLVACGAPGDPCPSDCTADVGYTELHGLINLPIFQQGTPPYLDAGGAFQLDAGGVPQVARVEQVCFALAVPDEEAPAEGFPVVIFGHGTGGSFATAITNGIARDLATGTLGSVPVHAATIAIDMPQHGTRRGGSDRSPDELFFNFMNPGAARDNIAQGSADLMALVLWARSYSILAAGSPTGRAISFNPGRVALFAHSQGSMHASLMLPYEPDLAAAVLSGNGALLTRSLLTKKKPVDIASALPFALLDPTSDGKLEGGDYHPVLALFQMYFERVDAINFAYRIQNEPTDAAPSGHDLFMPFGLDDNFSTDPTQSAYARAAGLTVVGDDLIGLGTTRADGPLSGNQELEGSARTIGLRQYRPSAGEDGHFVSFDPAKGRPDVLHFLLTALAGQVPEIGQ